MISIKLKLLCCSVFLSSFLVGCGEKAPESSEISSPNEGKTISANLSDKQVENIVRHTYQYVAMYNVNNKFAIKQGGWNSCIADTALKDHTMREIARPNNDTLYISCMLDLRNEPVIIDIPSIDTSYASLMVTGYDHYVNVPLSITKGDFKAPEKVLFYTKRTKDFGGEKIEGVDRNLEMTGDFVSAVFRVMPHANDSARFKNIIEQMKAVKTLSLSEYQGKPAKILDEIGFPNVGDTDADVYKNNLTEVLQFVVNHTTFDPNNQLDEEFLSAIKPLGIEPGQTYDQNMEFKLDGDRFKAVVERIRKTEFATAMDPGQMSKFSLVLFKPKGHMNLDSLLLQSVIGPIGLPATEAVYPPITTKDGQPMNAQNDYVVHMSKDQLPPAKAFWSVTLYDSKNGFFIPNDRKKYSVGENAGMKFNSEGGIDIYIAAEAPEGVPTDNWLPINRKDEELDLILRIYVPDLNAFKKYSIPKVEKIKVSHE